MNQIITTPSRLWRIPMMRYATKQWPKWQTSSCPWTRIFENNPCLKQDIPPLLPCFSLSLSLFLPLPWGEGTETYWFSAPGCPQNIIVFSMAVLPFRCRRLTSQWVKSRQLCTVLRRRVNTMLSVNTLAVRLTFHTRFTKAALHFDLCACAHVGGGG